MYKKMNKNNVKTRQWAVTRHRTALGAKRMLPSAYHRKKRMCRALPEDRQSKAKVIAIPVDRDDMSSYLRGKPYIVPLLRSMLLGASSGAFVESLHTIGKFHTAWTNELLHSNILDTISATQTNFVVTLFVAHATCVVAYGAEASAMLSVLQTSGSDMILAVQRLKEKFTFAKTIVPNLPFEDAILQIALDEKTLQTDRQDQDDIKSTHNSFKDIADPEWTIPEGFGPLWPFEEQLRNPTYIPKGQYTSASSLPVGGSISLRRGEELGQRKAFLKNFWYAAALSQNLKDKPVPVELLGKKLVLFRGNEGQAHCVSDVCPHRAAPLSLGWTDNVNGEKCIVCPYHGWAFADTGVLKSVPANANGEQLPERPILPSYPVQEKGGYVWVFMGDEGFPEDERPPIPIIDELDKEGWKVAHGEIEFDAPHMSVFENSIDFAHIHYLHGDSFGNSEKPEVKDWQIEKRDMYGYRATLKVHNKPVNALWNWTSIPEVKVVVQTFMPYTSAIQIFLGSGVSMIVYVNVIPINEGKTINRLALIRNFASSEIFDSYAVSKMIEIQSEDKEMVEKLQPELLEREINVRADLLQLKCRKLFKEWIEFGYGTY